MLQAGCPVNCAYCMPVKLESRRTRWKQQHTWGINKTVLFVNRLPTDNPKVLSAIPDELLAGDYVGFQGITDPFWPIFEKDLEYMLNLSKQSRMRKLVLVTKWPVPKTRLEKLCQYPKVMLVVSVTGLDLIEKVPTSKRIQVIKDAFDLGLDVLPLIHPYIHGAADLSFLEQLAETGIKEVSIKGFRYNPQTMANWACEIIPPEVLAEYNANPEEELMLGYDEAKSTAEQAGLVFVNFRERVHRPNGIPGVSPEEAAKAVSVLKNLCTISSSADNEEVWETVYRRRIKEVRPPFSVMRGEGENEN